MNVMDRESANGYIKRRVPCTDFLTPSKNGMFCCPVCGSGTGKKKTGALKYFEEENVCACYGKCAPTGKKCKVYDVFDIYMKKYNVEYAEALQGLAKICNITLLPYSGDGGTDPERPKESRTYPAPAGNINIGNLVTDDTETLEAAQTAKPSEDKETDVDTENKPKTEDASVPDGDATKVDYMEYFEKCHKQLSDPVAVRYLKSRGISYSTAYKYWIGFDPKADPANAPGGICKKNYSYPAPRLIYPGSRTYYAARRIDGEAKFEKMNCGSPALFYSKAFKKAKVVFVAEGALSAVSIAEVMDKDACADVCALNSRNNTAVLIDFLKRKPTQAVLILCLDNDEYGREATASLLPELDQLGVKYIDVSQSILVEGEDPNDELLRNRNSFTWNVRGSIEDALQLLPEAPEKPREPLQGLLTYDGAVSIFQNADDRKLELKSFPEFSKMAKIKVHDSIVIAADTGGGKSSLALNFLNDLNDRYPCIYINLEMDAVEVLQRLVSINSGMELDRVEGYKQDERTQEAVNSFLKALTSRKPLQVIQDVYELDEIESLVRKSIQGREEPTIVFIDHSLLVQTANKDRYSRFTDISEGLRRLSRLNNIVLFILLQQNREGKKDEDERPRNSSLKESGSWENDATHIMFLWWDAAIKRKRIILTKNRHGGIGEFILSYAPKSQTYREDPQAVSVEKAKTGKRKLSRRESTQQKYEDAYQIALINTRGNVTLQAMAEAAGVTTSTVKGWIKEFGGATVNGERIDPAGLDTSIEWDGFVKVTPGDGDPVPDTSIGEESISVGIDEIEPTFD